MISAGRGGGAIEAEEGKGRKGEERWVGEEGAEGRREASSLGW